MAIEVAIYKKRALFGRPYHFSNEGPSLIENIYPSKDLENKYVLRLLMNRGTQESPTVAIHDANTQRPDFVDRGINHDQGGWPKELNVADEEAVIRYQKKLEREENYIESMKTLTKPVEHAVLQNNAINIYEKYFENVIKEYTVSERLSAITSIFRDICDPPRQCSHLSWSPGNNPAFAASYCNTMWKSEIIQNEVSESYIWDVEIPGRPQITFHSQSPIVNLEWNNRDKNFLVGGLFNGQIAFYDTRKGSNPVDITPVEVAHHAPVHSVLWIHSKTSADFFSTSPDGVVKWWDCRYLNRYLDAHILDLSKNEKLSQSFSASCLEYDHTIPSRYLVGTDNGYVICGNRKTLKSEEKINWTMKTQVGPIFALERNALYSKFFLTIGDWSAKIWTEDCKESAIMWTKHYKTNLTGGAWSKSRFSVFFLTREDGYLDVWDFLSDQIEPILSIKVSTDPLTSLRINEEGELAVTGDQMGRVYLIRFGESLATCSKNERTILSLMFDRENRREKTLELRGKEIRLAQKIKAQQDEEEPTDDQTQTQKMDNIQKFEAIYWEQIDKYSEFQESDQLLTSEEEEHESEMTVFVEESSSYKDESDLKLSERQPSQEG